MKYFSVLCILFVLSVISYANVIQSESESIDDSNRVSEDNVKNNGDMASVQIEEEQACDGNGGTGGGETGGGGTDVGVASAGKGARKGKKGGGGAKAKKIK